MTSRFRCTPSTRPGGRSQGRPGLWALLLLVWSGASITGAAAAPEIRIARDGHAVLPIVTARHASPSVVEAAADLAATLHRLTGGTSKLATGDGRTGIAVGTTHDFPALAASLDGRLATTEWQHRDRYLLRSHEEGLYIIGASDRAVHFAVWDLLRRVGYRLYFASPRWEIVPLRPDAALSVDVLEQPAYADRRIWAAGGGSLSPQRRDWWRRWNLRNRMTEHGAADNIHASHMFPAVLAGQPLLFELHPEYLPLLEGRRTGHRNSIKFCLANGEARQAVVAHALAWLERHSDHASVSVEASDLYNWCQCDRCAAMGPTVNGMVVLANDAAESVARRWPGKYVGMLSYGEHDQPPGLPVHPRVAVFVATNLRAHRLPMLQLLDAWRERAGVVGVYDYYSVFTWTLSMPAKAQGGSVSYLSQSIPRYHSHGATMMCAEANEDWGPNGLGYYLASRLLWDVEADVQSLIDDFLNLAFGEAAPPMRRFYDIIDNRHARSGTPDFYEERLRLMCEALAEAWGIAGNQPGTADRLGDLILYMRYVHLTTERMRAAKGGDPAAVEVANAALLQFAHRIADRGLIPWHLLRQRPEARGIALPATAVPIEDGEVEQIIADAKGRWLDR